MDWSSVVHGPHRKAMRSLVQAYGDDANAILNALHEMSARVAIASGTDPDAFAAGVKHHWDHTAKAIEDHVNRAAH